eukprot:gene2931-3509_t
MGLFYGKFYLLGRWIADARQFTGSPGYDALTRMRFYLAQEGLDLGDIFGNFAAHTVTYDLGEEGHLQWKTEVVGISNGGSDGTGHCYELPCSLDKLKVQADLPASVGTGGAWVPGPVYPGPFSWTTMRIQSVPGGALYEFGLDFSVASHMWPGTDHELPILCGNDPRFFSSRIAVMESGAHRLPPGKHTPSRPRYYKIPGRRIDGFVVEVPPGDSYDIYLLAVATPPFQDTQPSIMSS